MPATVLQRPSVVANAKQASLGSIMERAAETAREMLGMDMAYIADTRAGLQEYAWLARTAWSDERMQAE